MIDTLIHAAIHKLAESGVEKLSGSDKDDAELRRQIRERDMAYHNKHYQIIDKSPVCQYFYKNVYEWLNVHEHVYTYVKYDEDEDNKIKLFKEYFRIADDEIILLARDTSFLNICNQGTVITNLGLHVLEDNDKPNDINVIRWEDIFNVKVVHKEEDAKLLFMSFKNSYYEYHFYNEKGNLIACLKDNNFFYTSRIMEINEKLAQAFKSISNVSRTKI